MAPSRGAQQQPHVRADRPFEYAAGNLARPDQGGDEHCLVQCETDALQQAPVCSPRSPR